MRVRADATERVVYSRNRDAGSILTRNAAQGEIGGS